MAINLYLNRLFIALLLTSQLAGAAEYFVSKEGTDSNDGLTKQTAFHTIQKGVDALAPGDTLTIGPGEYFEAVSRDHLGSEQRETVIRAEIPGTVWLRGDVPAPRFRKVDGYQFIYAADFELPAQAINEIDTRTILEQVPTFAELEFFPRAMHYDKDRKRLYLSTSDLQPPEQHHYTVSVLEGCGMLFDRPKRVVIEGLAFSGYNNRDLLESGRGKTNFVDGIRWGVMLRNASRCVIRQCAASFNGNGIGILSAAGLESKNDGVGGNLIEQCEAFANYTKLSQEGGNIVIFGHQNDRIRGCTAYIGDSNGIRVYGSGPGPAAIEDCFAWGHGINNLSMKGGGKEEFVTRRSIGLGKSHISNNDGVENSLLASRAQYGAPEGKVNWILLSREAGVDPNREFADFENFDFRLQGSSRFRNSGPAGEDRGAHPYRANIFYVSPSGNDEADGLSVATPKRSLATAVKRLKPSETLYLLPGQYDEAVLVEARGEAANPIAIRGWGKGKVAIAGKFAVRNSAHLSVERLTFEETVTVDESKHISFTNDFFEGAKKGFVANKSGGLRIENASFATASKAALSLGKGTSDVFLGNLWFENHAGKAIKTSTPEAIVYSGYHRFAGEPSLPGRLGKPVGPYRPLTDRAFPLTEPKVHSTSDTTANIEWWSPLPGTFELVWGTSPSFSEGESQRLRYKGSAFCSWSLTDLEPGTEYFFQIRSVIPDPFLAERGIQVAPPAPSPVISFRTLPKPHPARTYYLSPQGDDGNDGWSKEKPWRTLNHAASKVNAGDTVFLGDGVYSERVCIRATGSKEAPITFKSAPGERPVLDGDLRKLGSAFRIHGKSYLHFDGLSFTQFGNRFQDSSVAPEGIFQVGNSRQIRITRCFLDGRGRGYSTWFLAARDSSNVTVSNSVVVASFNAIILESCAETTIEHSIFLRPMIAVGWFRNAADQKVYFKHNIVTDSLPNKVRNRMFDVTRLASLVEEKNAFWLRIPGEERLLYHGVPPERVDDRLTEGYTAAQFSQLFSRGGSLLVDPGFAILARLPAVDQVLPAKPFDRLLSLDLPLDFEDLFATNPEVVKAGIGLEPSVFAGFPVKRLPLR